MRLIRANDYRDMSKKAANLIFSQVTLHPKSVLGLATGSTPVGLYELLGRWCREKNLDFSHATTINLDEYQGLGPTDETSYRYFMDTHLFHSINIRENRTFLPDGMSENEEEACREYERIIRSCGGIDLQLLGLGHNGHIGFNEPSGCFPAHTHAVALSENTRLSNARFFKSPEDVPYKAYTMGIGSIMKAKKIVLVVNGEEKAPAVRDMIRGPITPRMPASVLQLHPDVTVIADEAALSLL